MDVVKRYWNALDDASHSAIRKASFAGLALGLVLIAAMCFVYFDVVFLGTISDLAATQFALLPAFFVAAIAVCTYVYVLVYRAQGDQSQLVRVPRTRAAHTRYLD